MLSNTALFLYNDNIIYSVSDKPGPNCQWPVCGRCNFGSGSHLQSEDCNFFFSTLYKSISFQPYHLAVNPAPSLQTECGPAYLEPLAPGCLIAAPVSWTEAAAGHRSQVTFSADFASTGADDKCRQFYPIICFPLSRISPSSPSSGQLRPAWSMIRMERVGELIRSTKLYQDIQRLLVTTGHEGKYYNTQLSQ